VAGKWKVIPGVEASECPVSLITPEMLKILDIVTQNRQLHEAAGVSMYGPDVNLWPAWFADAVSVIQGQINLELNLHNA